MRGPSRRQHRLLAVRDGEHTQHLSNVRGGRETTLPSCFPRSRGEYKYLLVTMEAGGRNPIACSPTDAMVGWIHELVRAAVVTMEAGSRFRRRRGGRPTRARSPTYQQGTDTKKARPRGCMQRVR
jgi:hypothetical protein